MEKVRTPVFHIVYGTKDITAYISPYVESVTYTDHEHGKSDEIDIRIEDSDHRWKSAWYPSKGDVLTLKIGYRDEALLPCGSFEIDEIEFSGPPDVVNFKGLATPIKKALRQANTVAYENKTLAQIAQEIATKHALELIGEIQDIRVKRITQKQERDLAFLKRIAEEYGYVFKITDNKLVFYETGVLEAAAAMATIARTDMTSFSLRDKTDEVYRACTVSYHDPKGKQLVSHTESASGVIKGDTLKINERCESKAQAITKAQAALRKANGCQTEGTITLPGTPKLVAGLNIAVTGLYKLNGTYHVVSSRHIIDRSSGYKTELEVKRV